MKKLFLVISTLIILIYGFTQYQKSQVPKSSYITNPTSIAVDSDLLDWRVYRNDIDGYNFRFPSDWFFNDSLPLLPSMEDINNITDLTNYWEHFDQLVQKDHEFAGGFSNFLTFGGDNLMGIQRDVFHFIVHEPEPQKVINFLSEQYGPLGEQQEIQVGGLTAYQFTNNDLSWAFVSRDEKTYVFGATNIYELNSEGWSKQKVFAKLLSSIVFTKPHDFQSYLSDKATMLSTKLLNLEGELKNEILVDYLVRNPSATTERFVKVFKELKDDQWQIIKEDQVSYSTNPQKKQAMASKFTKVDAFKLSPDEKKQALLVVKNTFGINQQPQLTYYVFGVQQDGSFGEFALETAYLKPNKYLTEDELEPDTQCELKLESINALDEMGVEENLQVICGKGIDAHRTFTVLQKYQKGKFIQEIINEQILKEGYTINNNYLWHDSKKLLDTKFSDLMTAAHPEAYLRIEDYSIEHIVEHDGKNYLYLSGVAGCGGCIWFSPSYVLVDPANNSVTFETFKQNDSFLFKRGVESETGVYSPDGTSIAYVKTPALRDPAHGNITNETVWIFDLLTGEEEMVAEVKPGNSLIKCEMDMFCALDRKLLYWNSEPQELVIQIPVESESITESQSPLINPIETESIKED